MMLMRELWLLMKGVLQSARQAINSGLEPLGLTSAEGDILFHLAAEKEGLTQENLTQRLNIGKAAISRTVDALVRKGYAQRKRQPMDIRAYSVTLSEKALEISGKVDQVYAQVFDIIMQGIQAEDLNSTVKLLEQVDKNLGMAGPIK